MKKLLSPILNLFEKAEGHYIYKPLYRKILLVLAGLFLVIALSSLYVAIAFSVMGGLIPTVVFLAGSIVCAVVGLAGSDKAVANIWKSQ